MLRRIVIGGFCEERSAGWEDLRSLGVTMQGLGCRIELSKFNHSRLLDQSAICRAWQGPDAASVQACFLGRDSRGGPLQLKSLPC